MEPHKVVSHEEWLAARKDLARQRERSSLTRTRRAEREAPQAALGESSRRSMSSMHPRPANKPSADLFAGKSQLVVYHFMFGPGLGWRNRPELLVSGRSFRRERWCIWYIAMSRCSWSFSRAPLAEIEAFQKAHGLAPSCGCRPSRAISITIIRSPSTRKIGKGDALYNYKINRFPSDQRPGASVF